MKRLPPFKTSVFRQSIQKQNNQHLTQTVKMLFQCVSDLKDNIKKMNQNNLPSLNSQKEQIKDNLEERFNSIKVDIPYIGKFSDLEGRKKLQRWLGDLCRKVLSHGFKLFEADKLNEKKTKVFCSENLIYNIIEIVRKNNFGEEEIQFMDNCLKNNLFPFYLKMYPQSEESEINLSLLNSISETDNFLSNKNDLVFRSGVKFGFSESKDYYSKIMKFLNYVIDLPNETIENLTGQKTTLGEEFFSDVQNIFRKIENAEETQMMNMWDKNNPGFILREDKGVTEKSIRQVSKEENKYIQKVKSYTKYSIGRKLSKNVQLFTKKQIEEGDIKIDNTALMRIITKWCQELEENFEGIMKREEPFRMEDGNQRFMTKKDLLLLSKTLQIEKKKIDEYMNEILKNNYLLQSEISKDNLYEGLDYLSDLENKVGIFSSFVFKNNEYYLLTYLNRLIHGLLMASKKFSYHILAKYQKFENYKDIEVYLEKCQKQIQQQKISLDIQHRKKIPNLITFKVGDLLRCKCSSKQYQILALFNEIERINYFRPELFKIVRIKNRLTRGTKDILINLMYKNKMLVQMQLAVNADKSRFIQCSDKFNHFIYELKRADFGPFSELCNIWITNDPVAEFYIQQTQEISNQMNIHEHECQGNYEQEMFLPFRCGICEEYYANLAQFKGHKYCQKCKKYVCLPCNLRKLKNFQEVKELFPSLHSSEKEEQQIVLKPEQFTYDQIPEYGMAISLQEKKMRVKQFRKIQKDERKYLFTENSGQFKLLSQVTKKKDIKHFLNNYIVLTSKSLKANLQIITTQNVTLKYLIPKLFETSFKKEKQSIMINDESLNDIVINSFISKYEAFSKVKRINFMQNQIQNFSHLITLFPNIESAILSSNKIQCIPDQIQKLSKLEELYLNNNPILSISPKIKELKSLKILSLENKCTEKSLQIPQEITDIANLQQLNLKLLIVGLPQTIGKMKKLKQLSFWSSFDKKLPDSIIQCSKLQDIIAEDSSIQELPQRIENLKKLKKIIINKSLGSLPKHIGKCIRLQQIDFSKNKNLSEIPKQIGNLKCLRKLNLFENSNITEMPQEIKNCRRLQYLNLFGVKIKKLNFILECKHLKILILSGTDIQQIPHKVHQLKHLQQLSLGSTKITELPEYIGKCSKLEALDLSDCLISQIPASLSNCENLQTLQLVKTPITELPKDFIKIKSLKSLNLASSKIQKLPEDFGNLSHLISLNLMNTKIKSLPQSIGQCKSLQILQIKQTHLEYLPDSICCLKNLKQLNISLSSILQLPKDIGNCDNLENLYLNQTMIRQMPETLSDCEKLRIVEAQNTIFKHLPENIGNCQKLQYLWINNSHISKLPTSIVNCSKLEQISIFNSFLKQLPKDINKIKALRMLNIKGTKIQKIPENLKYCIDLQLLCDKNVEIPLDVQNAITINPQKHQEGEVVEQTEQKIDEENQ